MRRWFALFVLAVVVAPACKEDNDKTKIAVAVWSDLAVPDELDAIRLDATGTEAGTKTFSLTAASAADKTKPLVLLMLAPLTEKNPTITVKAMGLRNSAEVVAQAARVSFVEGRTLLLELVLNRDCQGKTCTSTPDFTCASGGCTQPIVVVGLPPYEPGKPFAGPDAGARIDSAIDSKGSEAASIDTRIADTAVLDIAVESLIDVAISPGTGGALGGTGGATGDGGDAVPDTDVKVSANFDIPGTYVAAQWRDATAATDGGRACVRMSDDAALFVCYWAGQQPWYENGAPYLVSWWERGGLAGEHPGFFGWGGLQSEWAAGSAAESNLWHPRNGNFRWAWEPAARMASVVQIEWDPLPNGVDGRSIYLRDLEIRRMTNAEWAECGDRELSPLGGEVRACTDPTRLAMLPKTVAALQDGTPIRLILNGDSWQVDHSRGPVEAYLMRSFPRANVTLAAATRGSTGASQVAPGWDDDTLITAEVAPRMPSSGLALVYLGGISSAYTEAEIPRWSGWIAKVRAAAAAAGCDSEVVIGSEAGGRSDMRAYMQAIATANDCAFFDAGGAMNDFLSDAGLTLAPLLRDNVHLGNPGWHILGRAFAAWLGATFPSTALGPRE